MRGFETILLILLGAVGVLALARRIGAPYPVLMAIAGAGLAFLPINVPFSIDPTLALALFVAPVLLDAAYDASPRDLKANWKPLLGLVVVAVGLTTVAVAATARLLVPDLSWAAAIALGAVVAPPDASAATAVLRQARPPHNITVILEGESLLNDATALLVYRLAVAAAMTGGSIEMEAIAPAFLLSVAGSLVVGPLIAVLLHQVMKRITDSPSSIILQFVGTFGTWVIAEHLHLSPILTVVSHAIVTARFAPARTPADLRVPAYAVWDTAVVVLNALAFVLIGLQLGPVIAAAPPGELQRWALVAGVVLGIVILMRLLWVMGRNAFARMRGESLGVEGERPTWQGGLVIGWCGMRGIVTVAAALALPSGFPQRGLILFTAFVVTLGTLLIQGLTLRPLLLLLAFDEADDPVDREVRHARIALADAALAALDGNDGRHAEALREELEFERRSASDAEDGDGRAILPGKQLHAESLKSRRARLLALRRDGEIGDDAFHRLEEELDYADLAVATRS